MIEFGGVAFAWQYVYLWRLEAKTENDIRAQKNRSFQYLVEKFYLEINSFKSIYYKIRAYKNRVWVNDILVTGVKLGRLFKTNLHKGNSRIQMERKQHNFGSKPCFLFINSVKQLLSFWIYFPN